MVWKEDAACWVCRDCVRLWRYDEESYRSGREIEFFFEFVDEFGMGYSVICLAKVYVDCECRVLLLYIGVYSI